MAIGLHHQKAREPWLRSDDTDNNKDMAMAVSSILGGEGCNEQGRRWRWLESIDGW